MKKTSVFCDYCAQEKPAYYAGIDISISLENKEYGLFFDVRGRLVNHEDETNTPADICQDCTKELLKKLCHIELAEGGADVKSY